MRGLYWLGAQQPGFRVATNHRWLPGCTEEITKPDIWMQIMLSELMSLLFTSDIPQSLKWLCGSLPPGLGTASSTEPGREGLHLRLFYDPNNLGIECDAISHAIILEIPRDRRVSLCYCPWTCGMKRQRAPSRQVARGPGLLRRCGTAHGVFSFCLAL